MTTIEIRTRNMYDQLSNAERLAANYLLHNLDHIFRYPLATLAERSGTSQGAWVRFCKSIGYDGIKALKNALFKEMKENAAENSASPTYHFTDVQSYPNLTSVAKSICASSILAVEDTLTLLDESILKEAVMKIKNARRIALFGIHASGTVATDLYNKLLRIGYPVIFSPDYHVSLTIAATLTSEDVAIFFSYSGETEEILRLSKIVGEQKACIISVTRPAENTLAAQAQCSLLVNSPQTDKRTGAMSARIAQLVMADILFTAIINQEYTKIEGCLEQTYCACRPGKKWNN